MTTVFLRPRRTVSEAVAYAWVLLVGMVRKKYPPLRPSSVKGLAVEQHVICTTFEGAVTEEMIGPVMPEEIVPGEGRHPLDLDQVLGRVHADRGLALVVAEDELHRAALDAAALVDVLDRQLRGLRDLLGDRRHRAGQRQHAADLHRAAPARTPAAAHRTAAGERRRAHDRASFPSFHVVLLR